MDIPLGVDVHCTDGRCGRSEFIILNPTSEEVTHIVVKEPRPSRLERLVPIDWIANTASDVILLNHSREDFVHLDLFRATDFVYTEIPLHDTDPRLTALWPYVVPSKRIVDDSIIRIKPDELAVHKGTAVRATDGQIGRVDEFIVGKKSGMITHMVMREGHLWGRREVSIPMSLIEKIEEDVVYLKVDKKAIEDMPSIQVTRRWG
jgi:sporulation protein YlmC with PRC-barrel domain